MGKLLKVVENRGKDNIPIIVKKCSRYPNTFHLDDGRVIYTYIKKKVMIIRYQVYHMHTFRLYLAFRRM